MAAEVTPKTFQAPQGDGSDELEERTPNILVVDDDADVRGSIADLLEERGYRVVQAADGQQAFDYLSANPPPDCVVLDLWMPVMDGWALTAEVDKGRLPRVPILVVTAAGGHFAYPVDSRYVLRKPFNLERLLMLIDELIERRPAPPSSD